MSAAETSVIAELHFRVESHLSVLYPQRDCAALADTVLALMNFGDSTCTPEPFQNHWHEGDIWVITYGDTIQCESAPPLQVLHQFLKHKLAGVVNGVHVLPFYPYSSDDGFSVINYVEVNPGLGEWPDIHRLAADFRLMADFVINHCSSRSVWFENFKKGIAPGVDYFFTADPDDDLSAVVRPRTNSLLRAVETASGTRHAWCTFSHDQVDLDFRNPEVLLEFIGILKHYLDNGISIFRLDAVAFVWKEVGSSCLNLPQTHEIVRLLRTLAEHYRSDAVIITETNIPTRENLAYFGNANEAHLIYNFSLPPLLLNTLVTGDCRHLKTWLMSMPPAQDGTTYLNFIASHDGIGLRPAEGLLAEEEIAALVKTMESFGGRISWRALDDQSSKPYEINISLYDALSGTQGGKDAYAIERFICAHAIMLALEGIPAFYMHSLLATGNDYQRLENTSHNRSINRHQWRRDELEASLAGETRHAAVFNRLCRLISLRKQQPAFHPNATQFVMHMGTAIFAFWRQSQNRRQSVFVLNNVTDQPQPVSMADINLTMTEDWTDLISGGAIGHHDSLELAPYQSLWITNRR